MNATPFHKNFLPGSNKTALRESVTTSFRVLSWKFQILIKLKNKVVQNLY